MSNGCVVFGLPSYGNSRINVQNASKWVTQPLRLRSFLVHSGIPCAISHVRIIEKMCCCIVTKTMESLMKVEMTNGAGARFDESVRDFLIERLPRLERCIKISKMRSYKLLMWQLETSGALSISCRVMCWSLGVPNKKCIRPVRIPVERKKKTAKHTYTQQKAKGQMQQTAAGCPCVSLAFEIARQFEFRQRKRAQVKTEEKNTCSSVIERRWCWLLCTLCLASFALAFAFTPIYAE